MGGTAQTQYGVTGDDREQDRLGMDAVDTEGAQATCARSQRSSAG